VELDISSDKSEYTVGEVARFIVTADFGPDGIAPDTWMTPTIWVLIDGKPQGPDTYPDYPMHEIQDDTKNVGWFVHPLLRGMWGTFRAEALVYEPEREELGKVHTDFTVRESPTQSN
jgi:hypothetical protein